MLKRASLISIAASTMLLTACGGGSNGAASEATFSVTSSSSSAPSSSTAAPTSTPAAAPSNASASAPTAPKAVASNAPAVTSRAPAPVQHAATPAPATTRAAIGADSPDGQITCQTAPVEGPALEARGHTSCAFAESVLAAAKANPFADTVQAYSPATHQTYTMTRNAGAVGTRYTGATGAEVWIWNGLLG